MGAPTQCQAIGHSERRFGAIRRENTHGTSVAMCRDMDPITIHISSLSSLGSAQRAEIAQFATGRGVSLSFLLPRLERYPQIARAVSNGELVAFQLFEQHAGGDRDLIYLGPLVSRRQSYAPLFRALVADLLRSGRPFWCAAEVENPRIFSALAELLPNVSYRGDLATTALDADVVRKALSCFGASISHVRGFDPKTLTSERGDAMIGDGLSHYQWVLFGWDGSVREERALMGELHANALRRVA